MGCEVYNPISDLWQNFKLGMLVKKSSLNFKSMRKANIPDEVIQSILLDQVNVDLAKDIKSKKLKFPEVDNSEI